MPNKMKDSGTRRTEIDCHPSCTVISAHISLSVLALMPENEIYLLLFRQLHSRAKICECLKQTMHKPKKRTGKNALRITYKIDIVVCLCLCVVA